MNDLAPSEALPETVDTVPGALAATAPLAPPEPAEPVKPPTAAESVAKAAEKVLADEAKASEAKPEIKDKPAPVKAAAPVAAEKPDTGQDEGKPPSEGKQVNAPARLLPKEREAWPNTPRVVQSAIERMEREHEAERETYKAATTFHDELRDYDTMAKGAQTTIKQALDRYVQFDKAISQDFGQGMAAIAKEQGKPPLEAVASLLKALGATPEQYAQHVIANPDAHKFAAPQPQRQQAPDPMRQELDQLRQQIQSDKEAAIRDRVHSEVVAPFAEAHPRFAELQDDIAFFLRSDKVPQSLSAAERLDVAYDMAERLNPSPHQPASVSDPDRDTAPSVAGKKSISGAPGTNTTRAKPRIMSVSETIAANARRMGAI